MFLFQLVVVSILSNCLFSHIQPTTKSEKKDFACPQYCGQWGSESIRNLEWEFVQCLYTAHELANYIAENHRERKGRYDWENFMPFEVKFYYKRPENYSSPWYQKALETSLHHHLIFSNCYSYISCFYNSQDDTSWEIRHIDDDKGHHLGKCFITHKCF